MGLFCKNLCILIECQDNIIHKETPCFAFGQIERDPSCECRMGRYIIDKENGKE